MTFLSAVNPKPRWTELVAHLRSLRRRDCFRQYKAGKNGASGSFGGFGSDEFDGGTW
jgi:hypothetical protein